MNSSGSIHVLYLYIYLLLKWIVQIMEDFWIGMDILRMLLWILYDPHFLMFDISAEHALAM